MNINERLEAIRQSLERTAAAQLRTQQEICELGLLARAIVRRGRRKKGGEAGK
jgi:hypothetical protein